MIGLDDAASKLGIALNFVFVIFIIFISDFTC